MEPQQAFSEPKSSSDRKFGLVMSGAFLLFGLFPLWRGGALRLWLVVPGILFLVSGILRPHLLAPLNRGWTILGLQLSKVTNPVLMALLFFGGVWPMGALMRLFGARPLGLHFDRNASTYWITRQPRDQRTAMHKQF